MADKLCLDWCDAIGGRLLPSQPDVLPGCDANPGQAVCIPSRLDLNRRTTPSRQICIITETHVPEVNGVSMTLAHLVRGLRARGHQVSVVRPDQKFLERPGRHCDSTDVLVRGLPLPWYRGLQFGLPAGGLLRSLWTCRRPDVVYVATEGPLGWSAVRAARHLGIPVLSGFHTNFHVYSRHYGLGWLQAFLFRYLRLFHNHATGTLVASAELRAHLEALGFRNVSVLGRGVDYQLFTPERRCGELRRRWGLAEGELAVLHVGRLAPEKNLRLAIDAYRAMKRHAPAKFILVGDGPLRVALQKEHPDLIFAGQKTGAELAMHYASGDIFLFPSETETFGNVTLEAMASGLAVIAYDYAAAKVHIRSGETGLLVPYGESKAFIAAAAGLIADRNGIDRIRRQARRHAVSADWAQVAETFERLLAGAYGSGQTAGNAINFG